MARNSPPQSFWDRLVEASEDLGLPCGLSDIARELDLWPSAVQKWKDNTSLPAQKNLIALAMNRGVNTEWLQTGRGAKLSESAMDAATRELLAIWTKLNDEAQGRLLTAARYERTATSEPAESKSTSADHVTNPQPRITPLIRPKK